MFDDFAFFLPRSNDGDLLRAVTLFCHVPTTGLRFAR